MMKLTKRILQVPDVRQRVRAGRLHQHVGPDVVEGVALHQRRTAAKSRSIRANVKHQTNSIVYLFIYNSNKRKTRYRFNSLYVLKEFEQT